MARSFLAAALLAMACAGCDDEQSLPTCPAEATPLDAPTLFAVNSLAETLSLVRLDSLSVTRDALLLGEIPNDVAIDPQGRRAAVVNSGSNSLTILSIDDALCTIGEIDLGRGTNPYAVALDARGNAFVSLLLTGEVAVVDLGTSSVITRTPVGRAPAGILVVGERVVVALSNWTLDENQVVRYGPGEVAILNAESGALLRRLPVGINPQSAAAAPDGTVHVVCTGNYGNTEPRVVGSIYVLDANLEEVIDSLHVGGAPAAIAITTAGRAYVAGDAGGLLEYESATLSWIAPLEAPLIPLPGFFDVAFDAQRSTLFIANFNEDLLFVLDAAADTLLGAAPLGDGPVSIAIRP